METAFRLLVGFIALGMLAAILNFVAARMDIDHAVDVSLARSGLTPTELERDLTYQSVGIALIIIFLVVPGILYGLALLVSFAVRRGRNRARILLTIASVLFLLYTVISVDGVVRFMSSGALGVAFGLLSIIQLPLVVAAIWLLFRPAANQYFRKT